MVTSGESVCQACGEPLPIGARFCPSCGVTTAAPSCSECGEQLTPQARFCPSCGSPASGGTPPPQAAAHPALAAPVAERRVTSVLFGDLVGFTPLSESRDPEEVRELLSRYFAECRTVIGRYGGTVEKFIGDAVMAVWGVPVAHEDDAERAVRAGLDLVQTIAAMGEGVGAPGLAMRVGVVTGEVAVTLGATAEGMVAGDAVNTAARVQSTAQPGQVWVDETTRSLGAAAIAFEDAGEHPLKGKAGPFHLWRATAIVADVGGGQRVDGLEAQLAGRDSELRLVKELYHSTKDTMRPKLVVIDGEPGVGKSRLAWEFEKYVDGLTATTRWHRGRCLSYGDGVAFWALAEAVRARLGLAEADSGDIVAARLEEALAEFVAAEDERAWIRPRLAALVGAGQAAGFAREDLFAAWTAFLEHVGEGENVVVLVIDDAQHADDGLLDFLDHLTSTARAGIFVLVLARPELLARRHDLGGRRATVIRLAPLDDSDMADLVDGLVVGLPPAARVALVARSEGVPLFAVETVRALIDRDLVVPREGRYVPAEGVDLDLESVGAPASLQALVAARLDALTPDERRVVTDASVLGVSFTREGLAAVSGDTLDLDAALASLQRKEILAIEQDRFSGERGQYRFVQSVVRQVAYATQSRRDRKLRHLAAADHLILEFDEFDDLAVVVAQHLLDAADASSVGDDDVPEITERACRLLERAATRALNLGAPAEAQRLIESALTRTHDPTQDAAFHLKAAEAANLAAHFPAAIAHADAATTFFDEAQMPVEAGLAAAAGGQARALSQDSGGAIEITEPRWRALDGTFGSARALLELSSTLADAYRRMGDYDTSARYADRTVVLAEALMDPHALAIAHNMLAIRYVSLGATVTAQALYESTAAIAREHGLLEVHARALNNLATIQISRELEVALELGREGIEVARRSGAVAQLDYCTGNYLLALWTAGRLTEFRELHNSAYEGVVDASMRITLAAIQAWGADAFGDPFPAEIAGDVTDNESDLAWIGDLDISRATVRGDLASAARIGEESMPHVLLAGGIDDDFMHLWPPIVLAALAAGDVDLAELLLEPVSTAEPGIVAPAVSAQLHRLRALIGAARGDDPTTVEADFRQGIGALNAFGAVGLHARAEEEFGRWLLEQGRTADAEELLAHARSTYTEIGATGWLAQLDALSRADAAHA